MIQDTMNQFYTYLNLPLQEKIVELTRIIDQAPNKDLQALFPHLISNIFSSTFSGGWGLQTITLNLNRYDFDAVSSFLDPQGPMFRLCYRLMSDPQLKYNLPFNELPLELQLTLERGRCAQFYADLLNMDSQTMNIVGLALNPFDYYIFNFALHLVINNNNKGSWDSWNSAYFALACDYLMHFLPTDPNVAVLPHLPNFTGKGPMVAPLQTANRPYSPSLLLIADMSGLSNEHTPQNQSRNEVWRSETVLQVFLDIWMCVEQSNFMSFDMIQRNSHPTIVSSPERVRIVRVLVKHIHSYSAKHLTDPASRSSALRKYSRQLMCSKGYQYVKHLVTTWPLDASFRLVLELWLSLIQPWRYMDKNIRQERYPQSQRNDEEVGSLDASYIQFIAENFPSYTYILQLVLPRFLRLDLATYKNAVMLFRLGKVFSQPHLIQILWNLENGIVSSIPQSPDSSFNASPFDQSYNYNGMSIHKYITVAKQAISELNLTSNFEYEPIWGEHGKQFATEFLRKIHSSKLTSEKNVEETQRKLNEQNQGFWASVMNWLMISSRTEDEMLLEEAKKVPTYLNLSLINFSNIYGLIDSSLLSTMPEEEEINTDQSSFANSTNFANSITNKLRNKPTDVHYMGDPDLMPITSYESTILVRILYQVASKLNEMYRDQLISLWNRNDMLGFAAREILQAPITTHSFVKNFVSHQRIVSHELPPRLSFRKLGSHAFIVWNCIGYLIFRMFSYSAYSYAFFILFIWMLFVLAKASLKLLRIIRT